MHIISQAGPAHKGVTMGRTRLASLRAMNLSNCKRLPANADGELLDPH